MRRKDREITDFGVMAEIISKSEVCHLALNGDDGFPYIVPLNFGMKLDGGKVILYFHCATEGRKLELIEKDSHACFEMCCETEALFVRERGYCTMNFRSVIGFGRIEMVDDDAEKMEGLTLIVEHFHHDDDFKFSTAAVPRTKVFKLVVERMTGKCKETK
ncbi:MAG: pyridoxamine 5'-phosphate oxidase family protein [Bacteroidales bacterium]|nr:pyridoxamine 5'-phosphate oxidase family protein [Bacteroidales bacterium]